MPKPYFSDGELRLLLTAVDFYAKTHRRASLHDLTLIRCKLRLIDVKKSGLAARRGYAAVREILDCFDV